MVAMKHSASASIDLTRILLKYAWRIGIHLEEIYKTVGLDPSILENTEARISLEQFNAIWKEIALQAEDQNFGLHFGKTVYNFPRGHILFSVMMNCPTVGDAIDKFFRYHSLMADVIQPQMNQQDDCAYFTWETIYPDLKLHRHHSEAVLSMLISILRRLTENKINLVEVRFTHPQPKDITEHQRIFCAPLLFQQPKNELVIEQKHLSLPIFLANPELLEILEQFAQKLLDRLYSPDTWPNKVIRLIGKMLLRGEKPGIESIAHDLAISTRHLQNRLKEEGTTY